MEQRGRRVAMMLAGVVGLVGAVVLLRQTEDGAANRDRSVVPTIAAAPTEVSRRADDGVLLPEPGDEPVAADGMVIEAGDRVLRVSWEPEPDVATGYDVQWRRSGDAQGQRMLVAASEVELRGLDNGVDYDVEVRSVDSFGRRSTEASTGTGTPSEPTTDPVRSAMTAMYDDFRDDAAPDPQRWAVQRAGRSCLRAGAGSGVEDDRLVLELRCGSSEAVLRSRVPLTLAAGPELGRVVVVTDGPAPGGELSITVVPGPVHALGVAAGTGLAPSASGVAVVDGRLPPGAVRMVAGATGAVVSAASDVPRTASSEAIELTRYETAPGVTSTWELRLTASGVQVLRDGAVVAAGDVAPTWPQATVLVGFSAPPGDTARLHVDGIGFTGVPADPPPVADVPNAVAGDAAVRPEDRGSTRRPLDAAPGAVAAQVQLLVGPTGECRDGDLTADFDGVSVPFRPAVPGGTPAGGPFCPIVADLTPDLLALLHTGRLTTPIVRSAASLAQSFGVGVLEVTYSPTATFERKPAADPPGPAPDTTRDAIARLSAELRDAAGEPLVDGEPVPRGRIVLEAVLDGLAGQRDTGRCGAVAGIEVRLDGKLVAAVPTTSDDGGAVAGRYRFAIAGSLFEPGSHVVEVRVVAAQEGARQRTQTLSFQVEG